MESFRKTENQPKTAFQDEKTTRFTLHYYQMKQKKKSQKTIIIDEEGKIVTGIF